MKTIFTFLALAAGTISALVIHPAQAHSDFSHAQIRQMVASGQILSLDDILSKHPERLHGRLLDLEVEREHGRIIYELEFLRENGRVVEFEIDAASGMVLEESYD